MAADPQQVESNPAVMECLSQEEDEVTDNLKISTHVEDGSGDASETNNEPENGGGITESNAGDNSGNIAETPNENDKNNTESAVNDNSGSIADTPNEVEENNSNEQVDQGDGVMSEVVNDVTDVIDTGAPLDDQLGVTDETSDTLEEGMNSEEAEEQSTMEETGEKKMVEATVNESDIVDEEQNVPGEPEEDSNSGIDQEVPVTEEEPENVDEIPDMGTSEAEGVDMGAINDEVVADDQDSGQSPLLQEADESSQDNTEAVDDVQDEEDNNASGASPEEVFEPANPILTDDNQDVKAMIEDNQSSNDAVDETAPTEEETMDEDADPEGTVEEPDDGMNTMADEQMDDNVEDSEDQSVTLANEASETRSGADDDGVGVELNDEDETENLLEESNFESINSDVQETDEKDAAEILGEDTGDSMDVDNAEDETGNEMSENIMETSDLGMKEASQSESIETNQANDNDALNSQSEQMELADNESTGTSNNEEAEGVLGNIENEDSINDSVIPNEELNLKEGLENDDKETNSAEDNLQSETEVTNKADEGSTFVDDQSVSDEQIADDAASDLQNSGIDKEGSVESDKDVTEETEPSIQAATGDDEVTESLGDSTDKIIDESESVENKEDDTDSNDHTKQSMEVIDDATKTTKGLDKEENNEEPMDDTNEVNKKESKDTKQPTDAADIIDIKDAKPVNEDDDILELTEMTDAGAEAMDVSEGSSAKPKDTQDEQKAGEPSETANKETTETLVETKKEIPETFGLDTGESSRTGDKGGDTTDEKIDEDTRAEDAEEDVSKIKIVGVTSAVWKDDESKSDSGLKISSVSGAEPVKSKTEEEKPDPTKPEPVKSETDKKPVDDIKKKEEDDDDDVIAIKEEKKPAPKPKASKIQKCIVCAKVGKCKYNIVRNGDVKHLCDDVCFKQFRSNPTTFLKQAETEKAKQTTETPVKNGTQPPTSTPPTAMAKPKTPLTSLLQNKKVGENYKTCAVCQLMNVKTSKPFLNWQDLDYCGEECLGKFQGNLSSACSYCSSLIQQTNKAKYCCRIGNDVKHFCTQSCNTEFVKRIKTCAYCNKDLAKENDSFMAPVGNEGMFKDFCTQACLLKYEDKNEKDGNSSSTVPKGNFPCAVCGKNGPVKHELYFEKKTHKLCSDPCYSAFQYANKLTLNACDNCGSNCFNEGQAPNFVQFEGKQKRFCSFMCVNSFRNKKKKPTPCAWCGTKKSNFDMIERVDSTNKFQLFCSLNCLSLYRVNLQATSNQAVMCDQCRKCVPAQYHLTMSDASVRNFCSYGCVMQFQSQFQSPANQKAPPNTAAQKQVQAPPPQQSPVTTTRSGRVVTRGVKQQAYVEQLQEQIIRKEVTKQTKPNQDPFLPIISNMVSLSPKVSQQQINIKSPANVTVTDQQSGMKTITTSTSGNQTVQQQIIIQPPPPKTVKNKSTLCKPFVQTKATACRPHTQTKEMQTEGKPEPEKIYIPVPVPIYCPTPLSMYTMPAPILIPVPVPIPVPVFIPTTKKSAAGILKQIKEIQERIPADPLEAELLMMAEAVAGKGEESSSDSDNDEPEVPSAAPTKEVTPAANSADLGEDMLQMALRMASEMSDEPVMDLENSLEPVAVNTERPPPPSPVVDMPDEQEDEEEFIPTARTRRSRGGTKRQTKASTRRNPKRQKTEPVPQPTYEEPSPSPPPVQVRPPDANFHLKYTYGVNAFKHWVTQKNAQIDTTVKSGNSRPFKTDILQCTADELNHALCLFVKEVRKPNGEEYAVDSIYYLCLGIQQYLFESGRIDNVFTDMYYERFTECLNELLCRYEPKLNQAGQLVCRIEEEHLWESKQLGAHSPHVLLNTLVYFNTKFFMLKTSEDHLKLSFTHIMKHWKKTASGRGSGTGPNLGRSVYLRYYCPTPQNKDNSQKKKKEEMPVYEQTENLDNPLRCPVKLYEFYLSKCPESIKNRNDTFYLVPERSCVPDSPVWYSTAMLGVDAMAKMLNRVRLVREIQEAHLHTQPIYI